MVTQIINIIRHGLSIIITYLYAFFSVSIAPFIRLYVHYRVRKGLEDCSRINERYGYTSLLRPTGRLIWFHSASVGETLSLRSFIAEWKNKYPTDHIMITTTTVTAAKIVHDQFPGVIHQFIPFDVWPWTKRFLNHWRPDNVFFVESELWPNIIMACRHRMIPMVLLNARLSDRSFRRWKRFRLVASHILNQFDECLAQGEETAERLNILGAKNVSVMANLKFGVKPLVVNDEKWGQLKAYFNGRPIWIAASTHPGEEKIIWNVHAILRRTFPTIVTIIAPRHPYRAASLYDEATRDGLHIQTLSDFTSNQSNLVEGLIIDAIGQLGTFYRLCDVVFMGGSLVPHGGQNPIEPALFGKPVLFGPHMHNFREVCDILTKAGAETIHNTDELAARLIDLLNAPHVREQKGASLVQAVCAQNEAQHALIERLGA